MKTVGITPIHSERFEASFMRFNYVKMMEDCGVMPILIPLTSSQTTLDYYISLCDSLLLTGGHDVAPKLYGEEKKEYCEQTSSLRDELETYLLEKFAGTDKPVLGICRGSQIMNAVFGGTLYQDIFIECNTAIDHCMELPHDRIAHDIQIVPDSQLFDILKSETIGVNSCHHQAIKEPAPDFEAMAFAPDGIIEAIRMKDKKFFIGVQWHPERLFENDLHNRHLIEAFAKAILES